MKGTGSISILHVIFLSMTFIGLKNHVTILPSLLTNSGRDSWIAVILATLLVIPWLLLLVHIQKKLNGTPMREWLLQNNSIAGKVFIYVTVFYLLLVAAFTMRETLQWVSTTFLTVTPILILFFIYTLLCIFLATSNLQSIVMVNVIVLFGVLVLGFFVAFVNIQVKDHSLLLPLFENGYTPVLKSIVYPASGFVELLMLLFIQHYFKEQLRFSHLLIMLLLLSWLTLGPLVGAIAEFGPIEAAKQRYPAYEEWRLATIGRFIEHLDFFSIYQWLTGAFVRIGFIIFIVIDLLGFTGKRKQVWTYVVPAFIFITLPLFLLSDRIFIEIKGKYFLVSTFFFFFALAFILAGFSKKRRKDKAA